MLRVGHHDDHDGNAADTDNDTERLSQLTSALSLTSMFSMTVMMTTASSTVSVSVPVPLTI